MRTVLRCVVVLYLNVFRFVEVDVFRLCCGRDSNRRACFILAIMRLERGDFYSTLRSCASIENSCGSKTSSLAASK